MNHEHAHIAERNIFGFWVYLMSDLVVFAGLFATFAVLRHATAGGVSASEILDLPFVLLETIVLLTSSFTAGLAVYFAHQQKKSLTLCALFATLILGLSFLGLEISEFVHLIGEGSGPERSAFLSAFFTLVGTHGLHILVGSLWLATLVVMIVRRGLTTSMVRKLGLFALFWHFLDLVWIFIFTFVYLFAAI